MMNTTSHQRTFTFLIFQINQIKKGGQLVLYRKIIKLIYFSCKISFFLLLLPLLLSLIIIIRLISPLILVRFGKLLSVRIGHYAANTELYLCERDAGIQPAKAFDYFFNAYEPICNKQLHLMWNRILRINKSVKYFYMANKVVPGSKKHIIPVSLSFRDRDIHNLYERVPPHLKFTEEEEKKGHAELEKMGLPKNAKFVLFHAREPSYLKMIWPKADYSYHNYRDSDIRNFIYAAEILADQGYYAIRMGATAEKALTLNNPRIIDYARLYRSEFMDVFLGAKCQFYLGDSCGINAIPYIFRRPVASTNFVPLEYALTWGSYDLFIPKLHWLEKEKRYMAFSEIFNTGAGIFYETQQFKQSGITLIENTPEEIAALAVEMDGRLKGVWKTTEEDEELQSRFWSIFPKSELHGVIKARIGTNFLRDHRHLL